MSTTTDLSRFGWMELKKLELLLTVMREQGLPEDFENCEVNPMLNVESGNVFLTNSEYQVAMLKGDKLESFYSCPECGFEGFKNEIGKDNGHGFADGCSDWVKGIIDEIK